MRISAKQLLHAREQLKDHLYKIFDAWQSGSGTVDGPFTLDLAVAACGRVVDATLDRMTGAPRQEAFYRISLNPDVNVTDVVNRVGSASVLTLRCIGKRADGHNDVYYLTARCDSLKTALEMLEAIRQGQGMVRDWEYYGG